MHCLIEVVGSLDDIPLRLFDSEEEARAYAAGDISADLEEVLVSLSRDVTPMHIALVYFDEQGKFKGSEVIREWGEDE